MLSLDRMVAVAPTPFIDGRDRPSEARSLGLALHHPPSLPRPPPVEVESEEVEGGRSLPRLLTRRRRSQRKQSSLVRVKAQSVSPEPLAEHIVHSTRVVLALEGDDEVIAVTNQGRPSSQPRLHLFSNQRSST